MTELRPLYPDDAELQALWERWSAAQQEWLDASAAFREVDGRAVTELRPGQDLSQGVRLEDLLAASERQERATAAFAAAEAEYIPKRDAYFRRKYGR